MKAFASNGFKPAGVLALALLAAPALADFLDFKSPAPGMHFTEGFPVRVLADSIDPDVWESLAAGMPQVECYWDGIQVGSRIGATDDLDDYDFSVPAVSVTAGTHLLKIKGYSLDGGILEKTMSIAVDSLPSGKTPLDLGGGSVNLSNVNWSGLIIRGGGATVTVSGNVTIQDCLVTGLTLLHGTVGTVDIERNTFEDTGPLAFTVSGAVTMKNNEFRANNRLTFAPTSNDDVAHVVDFTGSSNTNAKVFQGNRIAAGQIYFTGMSNWLIGGNTDAETNILMGPRCGVHVLNCSKCVVRGNYSRHNYRGKWSKGFNFDLSGSSSDPAAGIVVEHNLIRGGSWPVQSVAGEFRYNVVVVYGHNWLRSAGTGAVIHHNVFCPLTEEPTGSDQDGGFFFYDNEAVSIYNNTFDGGGAANTMSPFAAPFMRIRNGTPHLSLRNNLFTFQRNAKNGGPGDPAVYGDLAPAPLAYADYNAFYSPDNDTKDNYANAAVSGKTEGTPGFAGNDVNGVNGQLTASPFAGARIIPYETVVDEAAVWQGTQKLSAILAAFRARYAPKAGGPIINAGDPADNDSQGRRADIGAIDLGGHDLDKFGLFGAPPSETTPPTVSLTAPTAGVSLSGTVTLSANAADNAGGSGVVLVQFFMDGANIGQTAASPFTLSFNTSGYPAGSHTFSAKAWDAAGNSAVSAGVQATISTVIDAVPPARPTGLRHR